LCWRSQIYRRLPLAQTISDFIGENNPDGLNAEQWKDRHWQAPLGIEHSRWGSGGSLQCGTSSLMSCRDLARTALLWANDGQWPGRGQRQGSVALSLCTTAHPLCTIFANTFGASFA
jgi:hypothetical protein